MNYKKTPQGVFSAISQTFRFAGTLLLYQIQSFDMLWNLTGSSRTACWFLPGQGADQQLRFEHLLQAFRLKIVYAL